MHSKLFAALIVRINFSYLGLFALMSQLGNHPSKPKFARIFMKESLIASMVKDPRFPLLFAVTQVSS